MARFTITVTGLVDSSPEGRRRLNNASEKCQLPAGERVHCLIDLTSLGSAKNALLFGSQGIYLHNDWSGKSSGAQAIPYTELGQREIYDGGFQEIALSMNQFVNVAGCSCSKKTLIKLLTEIKAIFP